MYVASNAWVLGTVCFRHIFPSLYDLGEFAIRSLWADMAKGKPAPGVQNRHIYSRVSYLYQAASYLASRSAPNSTSGSNSEHITQTDDQKRAIQNVSRQLLGDMRSASLKVQIRQSSSVKRTICRYCDTLQIEGKTCNSVIENPSKGGKKPWADVLVSKCLTCGNSKHYPVSAKKQKRRHLREAAGVEKGNEDVKAGS